MRKAFIVTLTIAVLLVSSATAVLAAGGKVRGDEGAGTVAQHQVNDNVYWAE
jgi:hypothetical protein